MSRLTATVIVCLAFSLLGVSAVAYARSLPDSLVSVLMRVGEDGSIRSGERQWMRQRGFDKVAIAQTVKEARDGGRLTRPEAYKIVNGFRRRAQKNAPDPLDAICKRSPLYPPCQDR